MGHVLNIIHCDISFATIPLRSVYSKALFKNLMPLTRLPVSDTLYYGFNGALNLRVLLRDDLH